MEDLALGEVGWDMLGLLGGDHMLPFVSRELSRVPFLEELLLLDFFLILCDLEEELVSECLERVEGEAEADLVLRLGDRDPDQAEAEVSGGVQPRLERSELWLEAGASSGNLGATSCRETNMLNSSITVTNPLFIASILIRRCKNNE